MLGKHTNTITKPSIASPPGPWPPSVRPTNAVPEGTTAMPIRAATMT